MGLSDRASGSVDSNECTCWVLAKTFNFEFLEAVALKRTKFQISQIFAKSTPPQVGTFMLKWQFNAKNKKLSN